LDSFDLDLNKEKIYFKGNDEYLILFLYLNIIFFVEPLPYECGPIQL